MSGNTTRVGADSANASSHGVIPALLITGFVMGVAGGSILAHKAGRWRKPAVLSLVTLLLTVAATMMPLGHTVVMMAMLVLAMGALNNTVQNGDSTVPLTYLTGTLVRIGQGIAGTLTGRAQPGYSIYMVLWLSLAAGAITGAHMVGFLGQAALVPAAVLAAVMTAISWRIARHSSRPA